MDNPIEGLKDLVKLLKPNGILRLGLYSEIARQDIVKLRKIIDKKKFNNNIDDLRYFRQFIISENKSSDLYKSIFNKDFYTTSNVRDFYFTLKNIDTRYQKLSKFLKNLI